MRNYYKSHDIEIEIVEHQSWNTFVTIRKPIQEADDVMYHVEVCSHRDAEELIAILQEFIRMT